MHALVASLTISGIGSSGGCRSLEPTVSSWTQPAEVVQPNRYSNATHNTYDFRSTVENMTGVVQNNLDTESPWSPEVDNFLATGQEQTVVTSTAETAWAPRSSGIRNLLVTFTTESLDIVNLITRSLVRYFASRKRQITGLRASTLTVFQTGNTLPVVQWQEGGDTEAMALFNVEEENFCNFLIHYGEGTTFQPDTTRWRNPRVKWRVRDFENLKTLFVPLMPAVGRQQVPEDYLERRLFNNNVPESME